MSSKRPARQALFASLEEKAHLHERDEASRLCGPDQAYVPNILGYEFRLPWAFFLSTHPISDETALLWIVDSIERSASDKDTTS